MSNEIAATPQAAAPALTMPPKIWEMVETFKFASKLADKICQAGLAPYTRQGPMPAETVAICIMTGMELGLDPMAAMRGVAVINNRPSLFGDVMTGLVRSRGHQIKSWIVDKDPANVTAHCIVTRGDTGEKTERSFSMQEAKTAKLIGKPGPWTEYPRRMLQWRAVSWACRDAAADVLMGVPAYEEAIDMPASPMPPVDVTPAPASEPGDDPLAIPAAFDRRPPKAEPAEGAPPADLDLPETDGFASFDDWIVRAVVPWIGDLPDPVDADAVFDALADVTPFGDQILDDWRQHVSQALGARQ